MRFGMTNESAEEVATTVLSQLEGALLLARTYRSLEPMRRAEQAIKLLIKSSK
jgi:TetR/AcrR family transcriptional repressor of lmrAB and yxaGH operons